MTQISNYARMIGAVTVATFGTSAMAAPAAGPTAFCSAVKAAVAAAAETPNFNSITGAAKTFGFAGTLPLGALSDCSVARGSRVSSYLCTSPAPIPYVRAQAMTRSLQTQVGMCLAVPGQGPGQKATLGQYEREFVVDSAGRKVRVGVNYQNDGFNPQGRPEISVSPL